MNKFYIYVYALLIMLGTAFPAHSQAWKRDDHRYDNRYDNRDNHNDHKYERHEEHRFSPEEQALHEKEKRLDAMRKEMDERRAKSNKASSRFHLDEVIKQEAVLNKMQSDYNDLEREVNALRLECSRKHIIVQNSYVSTVYQPQQYVSYQGVPYSVNLVVNGSFEADYNIPDVYMSRHIVGWNSSFGRGIEVQANGVGGMQASNGNHLVELDSDNNSNMYQDIPSGGYNMFTLSFDYSPRPGVGAESNIIEIYWNGQLLDKVSGDQAGWQTLTYAMQGFRTVNRLEFRAGGISDGLGGYIDNVIVRPN